MLRALVCTGFRISIPLSTRSGISSEQPPQVWYQIFAFVRERMYWTSRLWRGLTTRR